MLWYLEDLGLPVLTSAKFPLMIIVCRGIGKESPAFG
jgi:hypothetical protein